MIPFTQYCALGTRGSLAARSRENSYKRDCNWLGVIKGIALVPRGPFRGENIRDEARNLREMRARRKCLWQPGYRSAAKELARGLKIRQM